MGRLATSLFLILTVGVVGLFPPAAAWRCVRMQQVMSHPCCAGDESSVDRAHDTAIGAPCCEPVPAPSLEARTTPRDDTPRIQPAPPSGLVAFLLPPLPSSWTAPPEAGSPGGRPHRFTPVLRI